MGMNDDAQRAARPDAVGADDTARSTAGSRGKITTRPSRESILQSYASQDEMRARDARLRSQQATHAAAERAAQRNAERAARQEALAAQQREQAAREAERTASASRAAGAQRRGRVVPPLSSQESYDLTRSSMESYERARASRDALSESRRGRAMNREVIDGRGSIDSRTFNESQQISAFARDERDRHDPMLDTMDGTSWHSRAGQGFAVPMEGGTGSIPPIPPIRPRASRASRVGLSSSVSGRRDYGSAPSGSSAIPLFIRITLPVIFILLAVIIYLLVF